MPITEVANELLNLYENIEVDKDIIDVQTISVPITALNTNQYVFSIQNTDQYVAMCDAYLHFKGTITKTAIPTGAIAPNNTLKLGFHSPGPPPGVHPRYTSGGLVSTPQAANIHEHLGSTPGDGFHSPGPHSKIS